MRRRWTRGSAPAEAPAPDPGAPADLPGALLPARGRGAVAGPLTEATDADLVAEMSRRVASGSFSAGETGGVLALDLQLATDVDDNRFSRARLHSQFTNYVGQFYQQDLEGATFVEVGCGDQNPLGVLFLLVLMGAGEAIGIDLAPPQDEGLAARGLARVAELALSDPRLVVGEYPITRAQVAANVGDFDIARLAAGDLGGIDGSRLRLIQGSVEDTGLPTASADYVFSTSLLEHVADLDAALAELARITRAGGWGWHVHDGIDHNSYSHPAHPPLAFLREPAGPALVNGSNRLRTLELPARFEEAGFEVVASYPYSRIEVPDSERATFAEPWRSMDGEVLAVRGALFFVRRRS